MMRMAGYSRLYSMPFPHWRKSLHCSLRIYNLISAPKLALRLWFTGFKYQFLGTLLFSKMLSSSLLTSWYLSRIDLVALVSYQHDWNRVWLLILDSSKLVIDTSAWGLLLCTVSPCIVYSRNLCSESFYSLKCSSSCNAIYQQKPFPFSNPLISKRRVFLCGRDGGFCHQQSPCIEVASIWGLLTLARCI